MWDPRPERLGRRSRSEGPGEGRGPVGEAREGSPRGWGGMTAATQSGLFVKRGSAALAEALRVLGPGAGRRPEAERRLSWRGPLATHCAPRYSFPWAGSPALLAPPLLWPGLAPYGQAGPLIPRCRSFKGSSFFL